MLPVTNAIESICRTNLRQGAQQERMGKTKSPGKCLKRALFLHEIKRINMRAR